MQILVERLHVRAADGFTWSTRRAAATGVMLLPLGGSQQFPPVSSALLRGATPCCFRGFSRGGGRLSGGATPWACRRRFSIRAPWRRTAARNARARRPVSHERKRRLELGSFFGAACVSCFMSFLGLTMVRGSSSCCFGSRAALCFSVVAAARHSAACAPHGEVAHAVAAARWRVPLPRLASSRCRIGRGAGWRRPADGRRHSAGGCVCPFRGPASVAAGRRRCSRRPACSGG